MLSDKDLRERIKLYQDALFAADAYEQLRLAIPEKPPEDLIAGSTSVSDHVNEAITRLVIDTWAGLRETLLYEKHQLLEHAQWRIAKFEAGEDV